MKAFLCFAILCAFLFTLTLAHWPSFNIDVSVAGGYLDLNKISEGTKTINFKFAHLGKDKTQDGADIIFRFPCSDATITDYITNVNNCQYVDPTTSDYVPFNLKASSFGASPSFTFSSSTAMWPASILQFRCDFTFKTVDFSICNDLNINVEHLNPKGHGYYPMTRDFASVDTDKNFNLFNQNWSPNFKTVVVIDDPSNNSSSMVATTIALIGTIVISVISLF